MLLGIAEQDSYLAYYDIAASQDVRSAYCYMVGWASSLKSHICFPSSHGHIKDFRFMRGDCWDFSFIPNQKWLLFYFRTPCLKLPHYSPAEILSRFPVAKKTSAGEYHVRISNLEAAVLLSTYIESADSSD